MPKTVISKRSKAIAGSKKSEEKAVDKPNNTFLPITRAGQKDLNKSSSGRNSKKEKETN